jgi:hypothetical protein
MPLKSFAAHQQSQFYSSAPRFGNIQAAGVMTFHLADFARFSLARSRSEISYLPLEEAFDLGIAPLVGIFRLENGGKTTFLMLA